MSTITRGQQMVSVLNTMGVHVACLGNHDLDFGLEQFCSLASQCNFPWMVSNVFDKESGSPLGGLETTVVLEWEGVTIGLMGLVEEDWMSTLAVLDPDDVAYHNFTTKGKELALELRNRGADLVIALTHMREPNDVLLLQSVPEIDLVMGGHDHHYTVRFIEPNGNLLVKSGSDFRDLTKIDVVIDLDGKRHYDWERLSVTGEVQEDSEMREIVGSFVKSMSDSLDQKIGRLSVDLDGRFDRIRTQETNLGNFVCDIVRMASKSEICFLNSGTFRSNRIHPAGDFTKRDLLDVLPMIDETVVLQISGRDLITVLENGVSQYPKLEGRFLQVSGLSFSFDPSKDPGNRILHDAVYIHDRDEVIDLQKIYTVCTKSYLAEGKDGFNVLQGATVVMDSEESPVLPTCIRYHFLTLDVLSTWKLETMHKSEALVRKFASKMKSVLRRSIRSRTDPETFSDRMKCYTITATTEDRIQCLSS
eukprot:g3518.t1